MSGNDVCEEKSITTCIWLPITFVFSLVGQRTTMCVCFAQDKPTLLLSHLFLSRYSHQCPGLDSKWSDFLNHGCLTSMSFQNSVFAVHVRKGSNHTNVILLCTLWLIVRKSDETHLSIFFFYESSHQKSIKAKAIFLLWINNVQLGIINVYWTSIMV